VLITRLVEYAQNERLTAADPFFEVKTVRWLAMISPQGAFVQLLKLGDEKRGLEYSVPKKVGGNAGGVATFGTDNPRFVLGYVENASDRKKAERDLGAFASLIRAAAAQQADQGEFQAAAAFYADDAQLEAAREAAALNRVKDGDRIAVAVTSSQNVPLFASDAGRAFWRAYRRAQEAAKPEQEAVLCLSCGEVKAPVLTSEKLMGVPDGQPSGTSLVSFDKEAFQSQGWEQNKNAPVCADCSFAYTRGLNHLLLRSNVPRTRLDLGGVAFQFWLDTGSAGDFVDNWFEQPDSAEAERLLMAARTGTLPPDAPNPRLFALGLRGNGGRAVVSDWFDTSLADAYRNLARWFDDVAVVLARDESEKGVIYRHTGELSRPPRLWVLCRATTRADDEVSPRTPSAMFRAALRGERLPLSIADACIRRLPLDGFDDFFAPARIGLIRCALNRRSSGERTLMPGLDPNNNEPAYLCGRLLATLEAIQSAGVGEVGANIVDRFYGKASTAPGLVFGTLLSLAQSHLGAIENEGQRVNLDRELSEIVGHLGGGLPRTLNLEDQGRFAIGYYHQKAHRFAEIRRRKDEREDAATRGTRRTNP
jgi:CRISPR-associated protein Csd1